MKEKGVKDRYNQRDQAVGRKDEIAMNKDT